MTRHLLSFLDFSPGKSIEEGQIRKTFCGILEGDDCQGKI